MKGNMCTWRGKKKGVLTKTDGGSPAKIAGKSAKKQLVCVWRGACVFEGIKHGYLTKTDRGCPTKKAGKILKNATCVYEGEYVPMSRCWWLELYHASIADVLSCITLLLLMSWAVSGFRCWCLELYHASIADVLNFRNSGTLGIVCDFHIFHILLSRKTNNLSSGFRVGIFCDSGPLDVVYGLCFFLFLNLNRNKSLIFRV